jgi:hypothetical protein
MDLLAIKRSLMPMSGPQDMGGGGGGGSSTGTQTQIQELPEWARGYAKNTLEKTAALSEKPYEAYNAPRIAGFSPMQQQAQQDAAGMQTNAGTGMGMGLAGAAALGGLNQDYQGGQFSGGRFGNRQAAQYMSPYIENAMQPQLREAQRSSDIMGQQNAAKAVGQGAFGGSRSGLVEAERQRNLGMQQGDIRAKGYQTAYEQAANQFNQDMTRGLTAQQLGEQSRQFGANLGLQGLNTALQGAGQLGTLGSQQFQQGMDINKLQNAYGGQQQALRQQGLSQAYQDFQNEQNYPYKQLGFMSDMIRGLPLGQVTSKSMYEPDPSAAQNLAALGAGAYGLSKFMAEGGMTYADGGSVDSQDNVSRIVSKLSDQQLQQAMQAAQARGDMDQLEAIQSEMGMRASERRGIAGGVSNEMATRMAGGGVVAFSRPTAANNYSLTDSETDETDLTERNLEPSPGDPKMFRTAKDYTMAALQGLTNQKGYVPMDAATRRSLTKKNYDELQEFAGEDPYAPALERGKKFETDLEAQGERGKGAVALSLIPALLRPGSKMRAFGEAAGVGGTGLAALDAAQSREKRALADYDFKIRDAQRKERMGLTKDAMGMTQGIESARAAADKATTSRLQAQGNVAAKFLQATRPVGGAGAGGKERDQAQAMRVYSTDLKRQYPEMPPEQIEAQALKMYLEQKGSGLPGVETRTDAATQKEARTIYNSRLAYGSDSLSKQYREADKAGDEAKAAALRARIAAEEGYNMPKVDGGGGGGGGGGGKGGGADIAAKAKTAFGSYDASKYDYRVTEDGRVQRKLKE